MGSGFTFEPIRPEYLSIVLACIYTSKTPDQLDNAVRQGHLRYRRAKDKTKSFARADLDEYMSAESILKAPKPKKEPKS